MDLAAAYLDGRDRFAALVATADAGTTVPLTPDWRVRDVLAHLVGVAEDLVAGGLPDFSEPKTKPEQAVAREEWTAAQVGRRRDWPVARLLAHWTAMEAGLVAALADERISVASRAAAPYDVACHLHDVRHAVGHPGDRDAPVTRLAFGVARAWLGNRLATLGLGPLRLSAGEREWTLGDGEPVATVSGPAFELFRAVSGRRSRAQLLALDWTGDAAAYLDVLSPYPLPDFPVVE
ncbi:MAG TPA: maleylpyruvate isomerase family mycothiol-dependent enzyme [Frankiaceae bacterium]|nr:maleylpyruvate isomerase family mycothiol-dependent enzyme [Frankiaceae bacterium]